MEGKTTSIVEKGLDPRRVMLGTIIPYYITVVNQRQDVRLEVKDQERLRKKPGKTRKRRKGSVIYRSGGC